MTTPNPVRPDDVAGARELTETALRDGYATLATVRENDLCVLDPTAAVLVDAQAWARWMAFTDQQRSLLRQASIGVLCAAGLLRPHPGAYVPQPETVGTGGAEPEISQYDVAPELAMPLLARQRPVFVVTGSATPPAADEWAPRLYGLADEASQTLTVVLEQVFAKSSGRFGHEIRFMLLSPAKAAEVLIGWLCIALRNTWEPAERTVRLITNPTGNPQVRSWTATPVADGWSVTVEPADQPSVDATVSGAAAGGRVNDAASMQRLTDDLIAALNGWGG